MIQINLIFKLSPYSSLIQVLINILQYLRSEDVSKIERCADKQNAVCDHVDLIVSLVKTTH